MTIADSDYELIADESIQKVRAIRGECGDCPDGLLRAIFVVAAQRGAIARLERDIDRIEEMGGRL